MNKEEIFNEISSCFKMSVDMNGMKKLEEYITNLQQENEKLNHYKLLYQKVKERNDKAIEWVRDWTHDPNDWFEIEARPSELLEILKGKNEVSNEDN